MVVGTRQNTPFYKKWWFWAFIIVLTVVGVVAWYSQYQKKSTGNDDGGQDDCKDGTIPGEECPPSTSPPPPDGDTSGPDKPDQGTGDPDKSDPPTEPPTQPEKKGTNTVWVVIGSLVGASVLGAGVFYLNKRMASDAVIPSGGGDDVGTPQTKTKQWEFAVTPKAFPELPQKLETIYKGFEDELGAIQEDDEEAEEAVVERVTEIREKLEPIWRPKYNKRKRGSIPKDSPLKKPKIDFETPILEAELEEAKRVLAWAQDALVTERYIGGQIEEYLRQKEALHRPKKVGKHRQRVEYKTLPLIDDLERTWRKNFVGKGKRTELTNSLIKEWNDAVLPLTDANMKGRRFGAPLMFGFPNQRTSFKNDHIKSMNWLKDKEIATKKKIAEITKELK